MIVVFFVACFLDFTILNLRNSSVKYIEVMLGHVVCLACF